MEIKMKFEEFKQNVEHWAQVRGIYDESTEAHQQAKALEEIGEYLTAETDEERMDAIGDIAVCIVNAAYFDSHGIDEFTASTEIWTIMYTASNLVGRYYSAAITTLSGVSNYHKYNFEDCLSKAWNEIKDRKGMMVNGKYVKWENLTMDQKMEFNRRNA